MARILIFSVSFPSQDGGIAVYAMEVARSLAARGYPVTVVGGSTDPEQDREIDALLPYPVLRFPRVRNKASNLIHRLRALAACAYRTHPTLVLATDWYGVGIVAWALAGVFGFRYAVVTHGNEILQCRAKPILRAVCRRVLRSAVRVIAVSSSTSHLVQQIFGSDLAVQTIPVGVNPETLESATDAAALARELGVEGRPLILSLGRLVRRKGHDRVMQAMPEVLRSVPQAVWLIAGQGPNEAALREMAGRLRLGDHVRFLGYVDRSLKGSILRLCDVYVLVPRTIEAEAEVEGFGISFLEAAALAKPSVAGKSGGVPDAVIDGVTGLLVDPESPAEIASAIIRLLGDPAERSRMGENARARVLSELTWDRTAVRLIEALNLD